MTEINRSVRNAQGAAEDPHERVLVELAHEILDFNVRVQRIIQPFASLERPETLTSFVRGVPQNSSALSAAKNVALRFATFAAFINMLYNAEPKLCTTNQNPSVVETNKTVSQNMKKKPKPQTTSTTNIASIATTSTESSILSKKQSTSSKDSSVVKTSPASDSVKDLRSESCSVSRKKLRHVQRRAIRVYEFDEKGFAVINTDPTLPAIRSANFLGSLFSKGGIKDPLTIFETPRAHQFLAFGPLTCLPKLQSAYVRSRIRLVRKCGFLNLPPLSVKPLDDLMEICADNPMCIDLLQLVLCLRGEIERLEAQELRWSPRKYFSDALRTHEKKCYETLQSSCSTYVLDPMPSPPGICAIE